MQRCTDPALGRFGSAGYGLVFLRCMRVMFVISIAALLTLLWATVSIARFVRRARQKQRTLRQGYSADAFSGNAPRTVFPGMPAPPRPQEQGGNDTLAPLARSENGRV